MKQILKIFLLSLFLLSTLQSADYSEMSTQELIAIMSVVKPANQKKFENELKKRVPQMSSKEKQDYEAKLEQLKQK